LLSCNKEQGNKEPNPFSGAQQKWAEKYGVKIEDYPYPAVFPIYYFVNKRAFGNSTAP